jgi:hypothetical protein
MRTEIRLFRFDERVSGSKRSTDGGYQHYKAYIFEFPEGEALDSLITIGDLSPKDIARVGTDFYAWNHKLYAWSPVPVTVELEELTAHLNTLAAESL